MSNKRTSPQYVVLAGLLALMLLLGACVPAPAAPAAPAADSAGATTEEAAPAEEGAAEEGAAEEAAPAGETKNIVFWHIQTDGGGPVLIQDAVDRFMADNPDVAVEVVPTQNDPYKTKIKVAMGAGNPPCVFMSWGGGPLYEYIQADQVIDLTEYMNADNYKNRFMDAALSLVTFDDKIYGVPVENTAVAMVWYNKTMFADLGLEAPKTYDELLNVINVLKENDIAPFALANKTKWTGSMYFMYLVDRLGGPEVFASAANRTGGSFEDPVFIQAGQMVQDLVNMGAFIEGFNGLDEDTGQSRQLFYAGKAGMYLMGSWTLGNFTNEAPEFFTDDVGFFPFPTIEGGAGDPNNVVGTVGDNFYHISPTCAYPDEAFEMLTYLIDDTSVEARIAEAKIPPVKGVQLADPVLQQVLDVVETAPSVQLWYDQYLPPELGELHKDTTQALFGLSMTPEEAAKAMEDGAKSYFGE